MNRMILPAAVAAFCAMGAVNNEASASEKAKSQDLGDLPCLENQIAEFNGELWDCIDTPSGGASGAPQYEFVDGLGSRLGDAVFIENRSTAWGYFDYLSTDSIIEVTVGTNKDGLSVWSFSGNFSKITPGIYYLPSDPTCSGTAYANIYSGGAATVPQMWDFLVSEPFYYWSGGSMWTEVIFSDVPPPDGTLSPAWSLRFSPGGACEIAGTVDVTDMREVSLALAVEAPNTLTPIFIVEKP